MLRTKVIDLVNSGEAWAFLGSGVSADAGGPTWRELLDSAVERLEASELVKNDTIFQASLTSRDLARCFGRLEQLTNRKDLEEAVCSCLSQLSSYGDLHAKLAEWPFRGYVTTNYDLLLEEAMHGSSQHGWSPVGNTDSEIRKLSGSPSNVVWHVHGFLASAGERAQKSKLILTDRDYDELYLDGSRTVDQLRGLLSLSQIVFIGFGFNDPEFERVLKLVGRLTSPDRPLYAFFPFRSGEFSSQICEDYLFRYNIDLIPYEVSNGSHKRLGSLLATYGALCVRRSMSFGRSITHAPSFDPETTGLMVYNELCLRPQEPMSGDTREALLRARILSALLADQSRTFTDLVDELYPRLNLLENGKYSKEEAGLAIVDAIENLVADGLASIDENGDITKVRLTSKASSIVATQRAGAEFLEDQFVASVQSRAQARCQNDSADRVADAAIEFLRKCILDRALGVALAFGNRGVTRSFHMVALLQNLPIYMETLANIDQAIALSNIIQNILSSPTDAERNYIGVGLQAQFAIHMLGYDSSTLTARAEQLATGVFLVDSSTLIPLLARSCFGHRAAKGLIKHLQALGATLATTPLLAREVAEHARYAMSKVDKNTGSPTSATYKSIGGWAGARSNAFLEGFVQEIAEGNTTPNFHDYLRKACNLQLAGKNCSQDSVESALVKLGLICRRLADWDGFVPLMWGEVEDHSMRITERRQEFGTYTHPRQTKAEGEVLVLVEGLRSGKLRAEAKNPEHAFFISRSRVVDNIVDASSPITINPESLMQWASTLNSCDIDELALLTDRLLWELSENNLKIVDVRLLQRVFGPMIDASKEALEETKVKHAELVAEHFGERGETAFRMIGDYEYPIVGEAYYRQYSEALEAKLEIEREKNKHASSVSSLTSGEKKELEIFRAEKREHERQARHKRRSIENRKVRKGK